MSVRIERVEPCEHGEWNPHRIGDGEVDAGADAAEFMAVMCLGSSRRLLTGFPPEAIEAAAREIAHQNGFKFEGYGVKYQDGWRKRAEAVLAAAWGHITGKDET